ncbi:hypothetical protein J6590_054396 [Homalodisca vitripennis]|nr:hypothetical protein J6590_054396 [Homalodisca vitripennis]
MVTTAIQGETEISKASPAHFQPHFAEVKLVIMAGTVVGELMPESQESTVEDVEGGSVGGYKRGVEFWLLCLGGAPEALVVRRFPALFPTVGTRVWNAVCHLYLLTVDRYFSAGPYQDKCHETVVKSLHLSGWPIKALRKHCTMNHTALEDV